MKNSEQPPSSTSIEQQGLPDIGISEILGLVELLKSKGGKEDIYKLAAELNMEFGHVLSVIRAAEILKLVHTPGGDVVLEPMGEKISRSKISHRKSLIKDQIAAIAVFRKVSDFLKDKEENEASRQDVLDVLAELLPNQNAEQSFSTLVQWGRYAELFGYNDDRETFYLDGGDKITN